MSDDINCCVMQLPGVYAWLLGGSVKRDKTGQMGVNIKETQVGPEYRLVQIRRNSDTDG